MKISPFKLERYFDKYEFSAPYLLSSSDCEPMILDELLEMDTSGIGSEFGKIKLGYTEAKGNPELREEISKLHTHITPDDVLTLVPEEGIFISMNVLLEKGDHVVATFPGYQSLYQVAIDIGCEVSKWEPDENLNFQISDLQRLIRPNTKLLVINFPHNPTGSLLTKDELTEVVDLSRQHNITIFSDEMYRFMEYDATNRLPSVSDLYEQSISLFGLSKTFGLPGLRLGWLTTRNRDLMERLITFKDYTTICNNALSEKLGIIALQQKEKVINRSLSIIQTNLAQIELFAKQNAHWFKWRTPKAGSIAFPKLAIQRSVMDFCQDLVNKKGVMLLPHNVYDFSRPHVRIGFGRKNLPEVLNVFSTYVKESAL
ncbi:MAG TPA: aminotransferase class I/II-fold pyridoxal phosphate-dependent enzyme [Cyclobacteriaceae bacterium]|nr:aminotransferase class I/II-fold pyridoxal phosphate-dependent enzyme [Cyclobacteriaceae bacterium]